MLVRIEWFFIKMSIHLQLKALQFHAKGRNAENDVVTIASHEVVLLLVSVIEQTNNKQLKQQISRQILCYLLVKMYYMTTNMGDKLEYRVGITPPYGCHE